MEKKERTLQYLETFTEGIAKNNYLLTIVFKVFILAKCNEIPRNAWDKQIKSAKLCITFHVYLFFVKVSVIKCCIKTYNIC